MDPDPAATLALKPEVDAAFAAGDIVFLSTRKNGTCYDGCPWAPLYEVRRPVTIAGRSVRSWISSRWSPTPTTCLAACRSGAASSSARFGEQRSRVLRPRRQVLTGPRITGNAGAIRAFDTAASEMAADGFADAGG